MAFPRRLVSNLALVSLDASDYARASSRDPQKETRMRSRPANLPVAVLVALWNRLHRLPGGNRLVSRLISRLVPYSGSIDPLVLDARAGFARVQIRECRAIRNHLGSVHAVALVNLGELTSGLAMLMGMPSDARGIVTGITIDYRKKARGRLVAECTCEPPRDNRRQELSVEAAIRDEVGDVVARLTAQWLVGPAPSGA